MDERLNFILTLPARGWGQCVVSKFPRDCIKTHTHKHKQPAKNENSHLNNIQILIILFNSLRKMPVILNYDGLEVYEWGWEGGCLWGQCIYVLATWNCYNYSHLKSRFNDHQLLIICFFLQHLSYSEIIYNF